MTTLAFVCALALSAPETAEPARATQQEIQASIDRSLANLKQEGLTWIKDRKCVSCHHVPMMIWALGEAQRRGQNIDQKALSTAIEFGLRDDNRGEALPDACITGEERTPLNMATVFMACGMRSADTVADERADGLARLLEHLRQTQRADGSWTCPPGRPPIMGDNEAATLLSALAIAVPGKQTAAPRSEQTEANSRVLLAARKWIAEQPAATDHQRLALRLLLLARLEPANEQVAKMAAKLLAMQNADGGWGQTKEMGSDAFATGQSLYALSYVPGVNRGNVERAQSFLVSDQMRGGWWYMMSRPIKGKVPLDADPIEYAASAWAALGLVSTLPR